MMPAPQPREKRTLLGLAVLGGVVGAIVIAVSLSGVGHPRYGISFTNSREAAVHIEWRLGDLQGKALERQLDLDAGARTFDPYVTDLPGAYMLEVQVNGDHAQERVNFGNGWSQPEVLVRQGSIEIVQGVF